MSAAIGGGGGQSAKARAGARGAPPQPQPLPQPLNANQASERATGAGSNSTVGLASGELEHEQRKQQQQQLQSEQPRARGNNERINFNTTDTNDQQESEEALRFHAGHELDDVARRHFLANQLAFSQTKRAAPAKLAKQESLLSSELGVGCDGVGVGQEEADELDENEEAARELLTQRTKNNEEETHAWPLSCCSCCCSCFAPIKSKQVASASAQPNRRETTKQKKKHLEEEEEKQSMCRRRKCLWLWPIALVLIYSVAIYCLPFIDFKPRVFEAPPTIPFDYRRGPLRPSAASQFRAEHLFRGQIHGAESVAVDARGNLYMAVEGGLILYAHVNKSSPFKAHYLMSGHQQQQQQQAGAPQALPFSGQELIKIAELNGVKQMASRQQQQQSDRSQRSEPPVQYRETSSGAWRRECQLDEQLYGSPFYSPTSNDLLAAAELSHNHHNNHQQQQKFVSHVKVSRCSKPLGLRLSPDESLLYVVDTLTGLYKIHLRVPERKYSNQRLVTRLVDFRANDWHQSLPAIQLDTLHQHSGDDAMGPARATRFMNVSLRAVDDLVIDFGAGARSGDLIYMSVASQQWPAVSFVYDILEGRPSGLLVRYDTGNGQLVALEPSQLAHVRTSGYGLSAELEPIEVGASSEAAAAALQQGRATFSMPNYGIPRLDENDVFDDRPLNFPNGLELMDDKQALLIVDTANKRVLKHYIRGARRGTTDLWAYVPNYADNIRRGFDKRDETYWTVGCGTPRKIRQSDDESTYSSDEGIFTNYADDPFISLRTWPVVRKLAAKNIYFLGWLLEQLGQKLLMSDNLRDFGYELKTGSYLCQSGCKAMLILQFNRNGEIVRSIHSHEFPDDLKYFSQVNELIDAQSQQHILYLSSPGYDYITKLTLPAESYPNLAGLANERSDVSYGSSRVDAYGSPNTNAVG